MIYQTQPYAKEITNIVLNRTPINKIIESFCDKLALGNARSCLIKKVDIDFRPKKPNLLLSFVVLINNAHINNNGIKLYDNYVDIDLAFEIDKKACRITSFYPSSNNPIYNLISLFIRQQFPKQFILDSLDDICVDE